MNFELEENTARLLSLKYSGVESPEFFKDVERLKAGEPFAYVIGYEEFLGARVDLSHKPMVPRPETAHWVNFAIEEIKKTKGNQSIRLIDLFSGSGNIGLGLLRNLPNAFVEFSEIDADLSEQILKSVRINNFDESRVKIFASDALEGMTGEYDAIFANPPYIDREAFDDLDTDQKEYEPHLAFFGNKDNKKGLYHHELLINNAWDYLKPGGVVYMEADEDQRPAIEKMLQNTNVPKWAYEFWSDQYGQVRFPVLRKIIN